MWFFLIKTYFCASLGHTVYFSSSKNVIIFKKTTSRSFSKWIFLKFTYSINFSNCNRSFSKALKLASNLEFLRRSWYNSRWSFWWVDSICFIRSSNLTFALSISFPFAANCWTALSRVEIKYFFKILIFSLAYKVKNSLLRYPNIFTFMYLYFLCSKILCFDAPK